VLPLLVVLLFALPAVAAPVPKALTKPPPSPNGVWKLVETNADGKLVPGGRTPEYWVIDREAVGIGTRELPIPQSNRASDLVAYDPTRPHLRKWAGFYAVVEVTGDTLVICHNITHGPELTASKTGVGFRRFTFERAESAK